MGFHSHGGTPIARWMLFVNGEIPVKNGWWYRGTHDDILAEIERKWSPQRKMMDSTLEAVSDCKNAKQVFHPFLCRLSPASFLQANVALKSVTWWMFVCLFVCWIDWLIVCLFLWLFVCLLVSCPNAHPPQFTNSTGGMPRVIFELHVSRWRSAGSRIHCPINTSENVMDGPSRRSMFHLVPASPC